MRNPNDNRQVLLILVLVIIALVLSGCGITAPRSSEGYANLDSPGMRDTDRTISLSLGRTTLRFAARFMDDEPETQALLRSLDGVRIRVYEVNGDTRRIQSNFEDMGSKLNSDGWTPIMLVAEDDELVKMFAKTNGDHIRGLTIVSADEKEVVMINVMGEIDPARFSDVMVALDVNEAPVVQIAAAE
jgi:hypothetical protein